MAIRNFLSNDFKYVVFSELHAEITDGKVNRAAYQILEAAVDCIAKKGSEYTSVGVLAKYAGVNENQIFYYFTSVENLKISVIKYIRVLFQKYVIESIEKNKDPNKIFDTYFNACFQWPKYFPKHTSVWLAFLHHANIDIEYRKINAMAVQIGLSRLETLIKMGVTQGSMKCKDIKKAANLIHLLITSQLLSEATEILDEEMLLSKRDLVKEQCLSLIK